MTGKPEIGLPEALVKTLHHFVPGFLPALARVTDPRDPARIVYSAQEELLVGILMFLFKVEARRNIKYQMATPALIENLQTIGEIFYPGTPFPDTLPHGCTLNYLLKRIPVKEVEGLRVEILRSLLRKKCLEGWRLMNLYYPIAVDGTGCITFSKRHCPHCLTKTYKETGQTIYYHPVLEAKLVLGNGLSLSVGTEFIENEQPDVKKQDCELKAFYRLTKRLKEDFPQLRICLLLDGIYAADPVFQLCEENRWAYLITFKEGSMPAVFAEYEALKDLSPEQTRTIDSDDRRQVYRWVNNMDYQNHSLNALECLESSKGKETRFVHLSRLQVDAGNVKMLSDQGRDRWKIENQGFNVQKNGGYGLEHAYSTNNNAMKNFYLLMQIAHIFSQLMEKGSLLRDRLRADMGSLKVFSRKLWACLTETVIDPGRLRRILGRRIQIRFETG